MRKLVLATTIIVGGVAAAHAATLSSLITRNYTPIVRPVTTTCTTNCLTYFPYTCTTVCR